MSGAKSQKWVHQKPTNNKPFTVMAALTVNTDSKDNTWQIQKMMNITQEQWKIDKDRNNKRKYVTVITGSFLNITFLDI